MIFSLFYLFVVSQIEANPGLPVFVDYSPPTGFLCEELLSSEFYTVLQADSGYFEIVPLVFSDSLPLPQLMALNSIGDTLFLDPPAVSVTGWFPDSLMIPSLPPFPAYMNIPPGLPEDYARNLSFWLVWGESPGFPWLWVSIGFVLLIAILFFFLWRRKKMKILPEDTIVEVVTGKAAENEALILLESEHFLHGHWPELYSEVESQFRSTISGKFGVVNKALTLNQIARTLASTAGGRKFLEQAEPVLKETTLQRYADWGSSHERAAGFIRRLAKLRREWS